MSVWSEGLPARIAEREQWQRDVLPALKLRDAEKAARRARVGELIVLGLNTIGATDEQRREVFDLTGFGL